MDQQNSLNNRKWRGGNGNGNSAGMGFCLIRLTSEFSLPEKYSDLSLLSSLSSPFSLLFTSIFVSDHSIRLIVLKYPERLSYRQNLEGVGYTELDPYASCIPFHAQTRPRWVDGFACVCVCVKVPHWLENGLAVCLYGLGHSSTYELAFEIQSQKCSWLRSLPLVCAHGGDSSKAFPNTADCIEVDVSRSSDGVLFALHDRELQRITGSNNSKVSYLSSKEIKELDAVRQLKLEHHDLTVPTLEDALKLISGSARRVILDAKVGPPLYEKEFAKDLLSVVDNTGCRNCLVWAKSDSFSRDVMKLSSDVMVGYIVMIDPSTGTRMKLLRLRGAAVVGVYHPLIDENLMKILRGRNKKVYAWTVDDEDSMKKMLFERVDAIVTSNPSLLQRLMQDVRTQCLEEGFSLSP
ncbi:glycerophosphodiester phosphodiesterase GDPD4 isoform X2 [Capsicum annuum]|uniref:glycerophosphodiester phosphodiesterase GDPD4 isoform X2 n=1 Tax=Capsicum annuum TaxID=4072 RepID=UPI001FB1660B|nr:glycerophosphodiester phosphodiesterase GDPD4 isoform X2 [Capsicum annuum]